MLTALNLQRTNVIEHYRSAIQNLAQEFSQSLNYSCVTEALQRSLDEDAICLSDYNNELGSEVALQPYRRKLSFMWKRLEATLTTSSETSQSRGPRSLKGKVSANTGYPTA